jgi:hypothetical protein
LLLLADLQLAREEIYERRQHHEVWAVVIGE